jgi:type II secretory pathway predicted ATPase ExeA
MYESFYNFQEKPFSLLPDSDFLYLGKRHQEALSLLEYGLMQGASMVLITGEIGCGKTTLVRHLIKNQDLEMIVGNITNTHQTFGELLKWVMLAFGLEFRDQDKVELYRNLVEFLQAKYQEGKRVTLIIDEAQNLSAEALEELRMLSNINVDKEQMLQIILVGQPELRQTLVRPELRQLTQRIGVDYFLDSMNPQETLEYIRHRLQVAGGRADLYDIESIREIYLNSNGVPRLINTICDTALVYGYAEQATTIHKELIDEVVRDKSEGHILPLFKEDSFMHARSSNSARHVMLG